MGEDEAGHRSCSAHISTALEYSIELPAVCIGNFKAMPKMTEVDL